MIVTLILVGGVLAILLLVALRAIDDVAIQMDKQTTVITATVRHDLGTELLGIHNEIEIAELGKRIDALRESQQKLTKMLHEVVLENPGNVEDNDPGIALRRIRGVRAALWRMEQESYIASMKEPEKSE